MAFSAYVLWTRYIRYAAISGTVSQTFVEKVFTINKYFVTLSFRAIIMDNVLFDYEFHVIETCPHYA